MRSCYPNFEGALTRHEYDRLFETYKQTLDKVGKSLEKQGKSLAAAENDEYADLYPKYKLSKQRSHEADMHFESAGGCCGENVKGRVSASGSPGKRITKSPGKRVGFATTTEVSRTWQNGMLLGEGCSYIGKIGHAITCRNPSTDNLNPSMLVFHKWTAKKDWTATLESCDLAHDIALADIKKKEDHNRSNFLKTTDPQHQRLKHVENPYKNSFFIQAYS
jgi:hypothetical protein